ncbi:MAG: CPBP family intramembrane metalloprotease [Scytolyngbya sp. HA4215-MV1]|nr:CPBP family intramembrane metalloprotease [Scytolyngbya sp. HA4215-MV1]
MNRPSKHFQTRWVFWLVLFVLIIGLTMAGRSSAQSPTHPSAYAIAQRAEFNHPTYYPLHQTVDDRDYQPTADWLGRLILPSPTAAPTIDWVWVEILNAPAQNLIGQVVRLQWSPTPEIQARVQAVTQDVNFTAATEQSQQAGNVHPERLNHRTQVGPLQSLAGARPENDVLVALSQVTIDESNPDEPVLRIAAEPIQVTGRFYGLVQLLAAQPEKRTTTSGELFRVVHYNSLTQKFDGRQETIRIPQALPNAVGVLPSTPYRLEKSPAGSQGWYIYGAKNAAGMFVVQALKPRSLVQLRPHQILLGRQAALHYINHHHWQDSPKGTINTVLVDPRASQSAHAALAQWKVGDRALVIHAFGGIGGKQAEPQGVPGTITGHFAYGIAEIVRDRFTQELQWEVRYQQVYSHNPNGIIAGTVDWSDYMGNLQRGWLGTRPVSDVLIKLDAITQDYDFDGVKLSPLQELHQQLDVMMARYRIGDGTGAALVTPAQSCVQDSSQAVYQTIQLIEQQVKAHPTIQTWLRTHAHHPQTQRFQQLVKLGQALEKELKPLGVVRSDWQQNVQELAGIQSRGDRFIRKDSWLTQLLSWRTVIPRVVHDQVMTIFLNHGAALWFLRTNQVGGWDANIAPLAPTELLGQYYIIPNAFSRLIEAFRIPTVWNLLLAIVLFFSYGRVAFYLGTRQHFLRVTSVALSRPQMLRLALKTLIVPAFLSELVWRVLLIPHPTEGVDAPVWWVWTGISIVLNVLWYPLLAIAFRHSRSPQFLHPTFLLLTGLLGLVCAGVYSQTGSLWTIVLIHWGVVLLWQLHLGGMAPTPLLTKPDHLKNL